MSLEVIVLSLIMLWLVTKNRNSDKTKSQAFRVVNQDSNLTSPTTNSWNIRSLGAIAITSIFSGVVLAVFISVIVAVLVSKLTDSIGQ